MVDLEADHSGVCKFDSEDSPLYERVSLNLVILVEDVKETYFKSQRLAAEGEAATKAARIPTTFCVQSARIVELARNVSETEQ